MRKTTAILTLGITLAAGFAAAAETPQPLKIGAQAPDFELPGVDGRNHRLADFAEADVLALIFTCNHCPTAQAYEERIQRLHETYKDRGVAVVAISPNDPLAVRLDELGYTDLNDSLEDMVLRAEAEGFTFPYLYDGEDQEVSRAYGPLVTPHVFLFDRDRKLRYEGRFDDRDNPAEVTSHDTVDAIEALLSGREIAEPSTRVRGCSVKWSDKRHTVTESLERWAQEPVAVQGVDLDGVKALLANDSSKYRLLNVWATWCGPCVHEFPDLVEIHRMYRGRDFELVTISMDEPKYGEKVLEFLKGQEASSSNFHYQGEDPYAFIEAVDPNWRGEIPFTLLIAPGGEVLFRHTGQIEPLEVKRAIVKQLGRVYY